MIGRYIQLTLRELRLRFGNPRLIAILAIASAICAIAGPFETNDVMRPAPRLGYWVFMIFATYALAVVLYVLSHHVIRENKLAAKLARGLLIGLCLSLFITVVNFAVFSDYPLGAQQAPLFLTIWGSASLITFGIEIAMHRAHDVDTATAAKAPLLLERLKLEKRGALISLHAEDHYVRVETTKGSELLLMRLADAIDMAQPERGLKVHRSHWIALAQVRHYKKSGEAWDVIMSNDQSIPISRGFRADAIAQGIVPARG